MKGSNGHVVVLFCNTASAMLRFRKSFVSYLIAQSYRVVLIAQPDDFSEIVLREMGAVFVPLNITRSGINPLKEIATIAALYRVLAKIRPDVLICYTIKPNSYGPLVARLLNVRSIAVVTGLGFAFLHKSWASRIARFLLRVGLKSASQLVFLNASDRQAVCGCDQKLRSRASILPGEGIDVAHFRPASAAPPPPVRFLLVARLLADKGVREYIEAAKMIMDRFDGVRFEILGPLDPDNPASISSEELQGALQGERLVYHGTTDDVRPLIEAAHCVVLPSYREGIPRVLLEAGAMSRPTIATNVPGCAEVVLNGKTGLLCPPRNHEALATCMEEFLMMNNQERKLMGESARKRIEKYFSDARVNEAYQSILDNLST